jgi:hypothetical protein
MNVEKMGLGLLIKSYILLTTVARFLKTIQNKAVAFVIAWHTIPNSFLSLRVLKGTVHKLINNIHK